jgi:activator of HSP90 ATPase
MQPREEYDAEKPILQIVQFGSAPCAGSGKLKSQNPGGRMIDEKNNAANPADAQTRRQMIAGLAVALGGLAAGPSLLAKAQPQAMKEKPATAANVKRTFLHQEVTFPASAQRIYGLLLDSKEFASCTGMPAEIDPTAGGAFKTFGGLIEGRNVELAPNVRIVQAWRPTHWDPGVYSIVRFEFKRQGSGTRVVLDHTGFPQGEYDHLNPGWKIRYWDPMRKFLAASA